MTTNPPYNIKIILKSALHNTQGIRLKLWIGIFSFFALSDIINAIILHLPLLHTNQTGPFHQISLHTYIIGQLTASLFTGPLFAGIVVNIINHINQKTVTLPHFFSYYKNGWRFSLCFFFCTLLANVGIMITAVIMTWSKLQLGWLSLITIIILSASISGSLFTMAIPLIAQQKMGVFNALKHSCLVMVKQCRFITLSLILGSTMIVSLIGLTPVLIGSATANVAGIITGLLVSAYIEFWVIPILFSLHATNYHLLIENPQHESTT